MSKISIFYIAILSIIFCLSVSAQAQQIFIANLSAQQQVPPNNSNAKAVCKIKLNELQTDLELTCNYSNLLSGATFVRIHGNASVGGTAPALLNFPLNGGGRRKQRSTFFT